MRLFVFPILLLCAVSQSGVLCTPYGRDGGYLKAGYEKYWDKITDGVKSFRSWAYSYLSPSTISASSTTFTTTVYVKTTPTLTNTITAATKITTSSATATTSITSTAASTITITSLASTTYQTKAITSTTPLVTDSSTITSTSSSTLTSESTSKSTSTGSNTSLSSTSATYTSSSTSSTDSTSTTSSADSTSSPTSGPFDSQKLFSNSSTLLTLKALILCTENGGQQAPEHIFKAYGFPFDTQIIPSDFSTSGSFNLLEKVTLKSGGFLIRGRYSLIVLGDGTLSYDYNGTYRSALSAAQWSQLYAYEADYGVRQISLNVFPNTNGVQPLAKLNTNEAGCCPPNMEHKLFFNLANAPLAAAGIQASVPMQTMVNISHYPASIVNATKAIPIAHFSTNELFPQDTVAAAIIQHDDGRQQMAFYMAFGSWSQTSLLLCHMWFNWGTRGVYQGVRRLHLGIHIDDVFLPTETADSPYSTTYGVGLYTDRSGANVYRLTVDDVVNLVSWQDTLNSRLANGSDVRLEFAFNMNGAVMISKLDVDVPISFQGGISTTRNFTYKKPLGDGVSQWSDPLPVDIGLDKEALKQDPLFNHFVDNVDRLRQFHWVSHTFSHEELDQCTKYDAQNELKFNIQGAKLLGLEGQSFFSIRTMVTPQITGLFNGDALAAMKENGILAAVGDNSRTNLVSPRGLWFPVYTTMDTSNYDGGIIIPRSPAEVYFSCTTPELNQALYDKMYFAYYKGNSSYEENMQREANRAMYKFLSLTHDPYMFHQANLRTSLPTVTIGTQTGTFSLVQQWAEHVLQKMQSIVIWPVTSLKLDELLDSFLERELREACGLSTTLVLSKDVATLQGIEVVSTASCGGAVTVPVRNSELNVEKEVEGLIERDELGNEPLVIWMDNDKSKAFSFTLRTPIKWAAL